MQNLINWHRFDNADQVATAVCQHILNSAKQAIAERGAFKLVLAGGTTPEKIYRAAHRQLSDTTGFSRG